MTFSKIKIQAIKEENYKYMSIDERRRILNKMTAFIKEINIEYKCFYIEK